MRRAALVLATLSGVGCVVADLDASGFDDCQDDGDCAVTDRCQWVEGVRDCVTVAALVTPEDDLAAATNRAAEADLDQVLLAAGTHTLSDTLRLPNGVSLIGGHDEAWAPGAQRSVVEGPAPTLERVCGVGSSGAIQSLRITPTGADVVAVRLEDCGPDVVVRDVVTPGTLAIVGGAPTLTDVVTEDD